MTIPAVARLIALLCLPTLVGLAAFSLASSAQSGDLVSPIKRPLRARPTDVLPGRPDDPAWSVARPARIPVSRPARSDGRPRTIESVDVRALMAQDDVAFLLEWNDPSEDRGTGGSSTGPDAVAIQFPVAHPSTGTPPSALFGDPSHPVRLWTWTPGGGAAEVVASGTASFLASEPVPSGRVAGEGAHADGRWSIVLRGQLDAPLSSDEPFPFEVYVWDGSGGDAGLATHASGWRDLLKEDHLMPLARGVAAGLGVLLLEWVLFLLRRARC